MPRHPVVTDALLDAALGPEAAPDRKASSPPFFHGRLAERLTRAHWASPYLLYLPLAALLLARELLALGSGGRSPGGLLGLVAAGALAWTFVEYWLHRLFFHMRPTTPARRVTSFVVHRHHHVAPGDRTRLVATPIQSGGLFLLLLGAAAPLGPARWPLLAGAMLGYLGYELVHFSAHHRRPRTRIGRALRRHHLRHHFTDPAHNFGISSPLWDMVFRTCSPRHAPTDMPADDA